MLKSFLILSILQIFLYANKQLLLVVADKESSTVAKLYAFEDKKLIFNAIEVNLGKNGLSATKQEGDGKSPSGEFSLSAIFGYAKSYKTKMPYIQAKHNLLCIDDISSPNYNKIVKYSGESLKSFELMHRDDNQYKLGIVVDYNKEGVKNSGSCIFIHIQKAPLSPSAGCTTMKEDDLVKIIKWLDISKNPTLLQITKDKLDSYKK